MKTAGRRAKWTKIWASRQLLGVCMILLTFKCLSSVWGHSVYFGAFSTELYLKKKRMVVERNGPKLDIEGTYLVFLFYCWPLSVQGQSELIQCVSDFFRQDYTSLLACSYMAVRYKCNLLLSTSICGRMKTKQSWGLVRRENAVYWGTLTMNMSRSFWGHSVHCFLKRYSN